MAQFLLVRRDDLVHIGLEFFGFRLDAPAGGTRPRLVAAAADARVVVTVPPQSMGERFAFPNDLFFRAFAQRAGSSRVRFAVPINTAVELNARSIFTLL